MKQFLTAMILLLMGFTAFSQESPVLRAHNLMGSKHIDGTPRWAQVDDPFACLSITGDDVDLQALLDQGMGVVVAFAHTWSPACWTLHRSGLLDTINSIDSVQVIWAEIETTNTVEAIYGNSAGGTTMGDWTVNESGDSVTYPLIDDISHACLQNFADLYDGSTPAVFYVAPSGYYCQIYGESYGFTAHTQGEVVRAHIAYLQAHSPAAGEAPFVRIIGPNGVMLGDTATYVAEYISVDSVISVDWHASNYAGFNPHGDSARFAWSESYPQIVTLTVTNTSGSTSDTMLVSINDWHWTDVMSYAQDTVYETNIGGMSELTWGVKFPYYTLAGRHYLDYVKVFSGITAHYTLKVYQPIVDNEPSTRNQVYEYTYPVTPTADYITFPIYGSVAIDTTKDLWVTLTCSDYTYPASGTTYSGDPNGSLVYYEGEWYPVYELSDYYVSWMIQVATSADPVLNVDLVAPSRIYPGRPASFVAAAPADAVCEWTFNGATPAYATGHEVSTTWSQAGDYLVRLTVTTASDTLVLNQTVTVRECNPRTLPYYCGFESEEDLDCWHFVDRDGDGYNWCFPTDFLPTGWYRTGRNSIGSASYINLVGDLTPDNWMITPAFAIPAEGATMSFYVGSPDEFYYNDYFSILVSTTGEELEDFTRVLWAGTMSTHVWSQKSFDLSEYVGQNVRLAFRHYNSAQIYWIMIDDFQVVSGHSAAVDLVAEAPVQLYPNPTTGLLHIEAEGVESVVVMDVNGSTLMTLPAARTVDLSSLPNAVYFVRILTQTGVTTTKIIKK